MAGGNSMAADGSRPATREAGVNVRMISHGASKNNIAFVVDDAEVEKAVGGLHARFFP